MSFLLEGAHPNDVGMLLDQQGVAVRTGNHCAQPIMEQYGIRVRCVRVWPFTTPG
ncbi:aminotransferase class V-fold PLP-dependent enzyme [Halopseudomonas pachastrellae]|nr:aminotransferase class V-fold PLP-dependent enzyme [Halopseudomonas pachastrellae]